ncbi:class II aldolase/adducin family protein, partial [Mesorhizobium sp. M1136]|uniref:class II aldolase/adducin family protein n=1 Tax=Mesorhizobium sp. M1136 TaxID=2957059 RepID=UPI00333B68B6
FARLSVTAPHDSLPPLRGQSESRTWYCREPFFNSLLAVKDNFIEGIDNHFTLTVPGEPDRFFLNAFGLHWSEVKASNLIEVSLDGAVVAGNGIANLSAVCIHAPIHRHGIKCVLHTHMTYTTALNQLEDNGFAETQDEGERMADVLGDKKILMLANPGAVATGDSVAKAYHRLYFLERAAMTQMIAMAAGKQHMTSEAVQDRIRSSLGVSGHGPWGRDPHVFRRHETSAKSRRVGFRRII